MNGLGLGVRDVLSLVREADAARAASPVLVIGVLADQLRRELGRDGEPDAVSGSASPERAAAVVCVVGALLELDALATLRRATRAGVPIVGVRLAEGTPLPYVLPEHVVDCPPGSGFPVAAIATALVSALGDDAQGLASRLPVLREPAERTATVRAAARAAAFSALSSDPHLPALSMLQARTLLSAGAGATATDDARVRAGAALGVSLLTGLAARALARRLPPPLRPLIAAAATAGVGLLGARVGR